MFSVTRGEFVQRAAAARSSVGAGGRVALPVSLRLLSDQLTPVLAYRRLVARDERAEPSFLLESVEGGDRQGRHSILGARPTLEFVARGQAVRVRDRRTGADRAFVCEDPLAAMRDLTADIKFYSAPAQTVARASRPCEQHSAYTGGTPVPPGSANTGETPVPPGSANTGGTPVPLGSANTGETPVPLGSANTGGTPVPPVDPALPGAMIGGWCGYASYDSVRYAEPGKLPFASAPTDDRALPDLHFGYYDRVVVFDHAEKVVHVIALVALGAGEEPGAAYDRAAADLAAIADALQTHSKPLASGFVTDAPPGEPLESNITRADHASMVERAKEHIRAGDIFQVVVGQRFERRSEADPFDVYRALRAVNPSPYMVYMQAEGCILVASSPEILCRVRRDRATGAMIVTNRPLAGTRRRGADPEEDAALEAELRRDPKERAEHIMLVDLGRNDVGRISEPGGVTLERVMDVERYSHVMHLSSTVTGRLRAGLDAWDVLRATLPVGTISGAPKIRAMQIIDELEPVRRGPYGGGIGYAGVTGEMDIALALRTIVVPTNLYDGNSWTYHIQAAGGIVADSDPDAEYQETVSKAAALARAIELAERAFKPATSGATITASQPRRDRGSNP